MDALTNKATNPNSEEGNSQKADIQAVIQIEEGSNPFLKIGGLHLIERAVLALEEEGVEVFYILKKAKQSASPPYPPQGGTDPCPDDKTEIIDKSELRPKIPSPHLNPATALSHLEEPVPNSLREGRGVMRSADQQQSFRLFDKIKTLPRLRSSNLQLLDNEATTLPSPTPYILVPCNHLYAQPTLHSFFEKTKTHSEQPFFATGQSGKNTGLFYFPKNYPLKRAIEKTANGALDDLQAIQLETAEWFHLKSPKDKKAASRFLRRSLYRTGDGLVSRKLNRPLSTRLSFLLANWKVHPNTITTFALLLSLIGAWFAGSGIYQQIVLGAFIFQIASILDGSDGELARLTYLTSRFGNWYEQIAGKMRYVVFFGALGIGAWQATGSRIYLFAVIVLGAMAFYMFSQMISFAWKRRHEEPRSIVPERTEIAEPNTLFGSIYTLWRGLNQQDMLALVTFLFCLIFLYQAMFWLALLGTTATAILVSRSVMNANMEEEGAAGKLLGKVDPFFFYLLGVIILCALIFHMDLTVIKESLTQIGSKVFLVFLVAILWIICYTMCIYTLVERKVTFSNLLFNQLTGDAYNQIIPLGGLGGEPYKIKHLTQWLDWHTASRAIVIDRLIHSNTGILFSAVAVGLTLIFLDDIPNGYYTPLLILSGVLATVSIGMTWLSLSKLPARAAGYFLKKLKIVDGFQVDTVPAKQFFLAFFFKFLGRTFSIVELFVMFSIIGLSPSVIDLAFVAGMVSMSATLFFVIPQGIGVNETGISLALDFLGYSIVLGVTIGLVRRARMVFWALFGVALHLASTAFSGFTWGKAGVND